MADTTTTFSVYVPLRAASTANTTLSASTKPKEWRPHIGVPVGYVNGDRSQPVHLDESWFRHLRFLGVNKLGGATFPTLPDVASFVTVTQATELITAAQDQMAAANAQALAALKEVVDGLVGGTSTIPSVVLARQEVNTWSSPVFTETGGGGGGD